MKQIATIVRVLDHGMAEVSVKRETACGHSCESCSGCGLKNESIRIIVRDPVGVTTGDQVVIVSSTKAVLGAAAAVYLLPILFFFIGYAATEGIEALFLRSIAVLLITAIGVFPAICLDRKGKRIQYVIQEKL